MSAAAPPERPDMFVRFGPGAAYACFRELPVSQLASSTFHGFLA